VQRFDVHAHFGMPDSPEAQQQRAAEAQRQGFKGAPPVASWSPQDAIAFMDGRGIGMQLVSLPLPMTPEQMRAINEHGAHIVTENPSRFGVLASLPMNDPDRAVEEIRYACDTLHVDGFALTTNYEGLYFGDERFEPVFAELDRRGATVLIHPVNPACFGDLGLGRPGPLIEFPMDTARTIVDAVFAGLFLRHRDMRFVLAHGGGVLPALAQRILLLGVKQWVANPHGLTREQLAVQLSSLYFDTAIAGTRAALGPAIELAGHDHLVFGSDFPPAGPDVIDQTIADLRSYLAASEREQMEATFEQLFPAAAGRAVNP
jgi:6-methylsalicylate decarboxylase